jgi:hypothetical protein
MNGPALILDDEDAPRCKDAWDILRLAQATNTLGQALSFVRNQRSLADFKHWLVNERSLNRALRPQRWSDPL